MLVTGEVSHQCGRIIGISDLTALFIGGLEEETPDRMSIRWGRGGLFTAVRQCSMMQTADAVVYKYIRILEMEQKSNRSRADWRIRSLSVIETQVGN